MQSYGFEGRFNIMCCRGSVVSLVGFNVRNQYYECDGGCMHACYILADLYHKQLLRLERCLAKGDNSVAIWC